jgi:peptide/nickel transport system ATP-binding protein
MLEASALVKRFGRLTAVDGVSFTVKPGRTLGVAGESGSGKSTLAKLVLRLVRPDAGHVTFEGKDISSMKGADMLRFRQKCQIVFQDPALSLDPRMRVHTILKEPFLIHGERGDLDSRIVALLKSVELDRLFLERFPRELSGGECQRVAIARALATDPEILICDEAVSALDALVRVQILNLLLRLQKERGVGILFISHDLKVVRHMSDDVLILKDGRVCEEGPRDTVFGNPRHAYTRSLLEASFLTPSA